MNRTYGREGSGAHDTRATELRLFKERPPLSLQQDLDRERIHWLQEQPAPASAVEVLTMDWLRRDGREAKALQVGERAPPFRLPDQYGRPVELASLLARGPTVLLFYRGDWCPFCSLTLRDYQRAASRFAALRAPLVAISPQVPTVTADRSPAPEQELCLLSDLGSHVGRAYGLTYELPGPLRALFEGVYGTSLPEINADGGWTLPIPATYLLAPDGRVICANVDVDYRRRTDPLRVLSRIAAFYCGGRQPDASV